MVEKNDDLKLKAAQLLAKGASEHEVASICGRSRSWVQNLKRKEDFQQLVQDMKNSISEGLVESAKSFSRDAAIGDFEDWANRRLALRDREWQIAQALLNKAEEILAFSLEERRWSFREAAIFLQIGSEVGRRSSELWEGDLNAAIALVRKFGFRVIDESKENDDE